MLEAKSIYRAGEIVSASDCDYNSSRLLGLICPFCSEAVFLRSGSTRQVNEKKQFVSACFAHYNVGTDGFNCERRALTKEGRQRIQQIKTEAKRQRLRLYNAYLWQMIADDRNISYQKLNRFASSMGRKRCEKLALKIQKDWEQSLSDIYTVINATVQLCAKTEMVQALTGIAKYQEVEEEALKQLSYFSTKVDLKLHTAICCEIADFLATKTSGYVFIKIVEATLLLLAIADNKGAEIIKTDSTVLLDAVAGFIAGTHWNDQIDKRLLPVN